MKRSWFSRAFLLFALLNFTTPAGAQTFETESPFWAGITDWLEELGDFDIEAEDFQYSVGVGMGVTPDFPGAVEYSFAALPLFQIRYKNIATLDPLGLRVRVWGNERFRARINLGFSESRGADRDSPVDRLPKVGMAGSIGGTFEGRVAGPVAVRITASKGFAGGHQGVTVSSALGLVLRSKDEFTLIPEVALNWGNNRYMDAFYGVTAAGSAASGLAAYNAGAGFYEAALRVTGQYQWNAHWSGLVRMEISRLVGDARDSSIVRELGKPTQATIGMGVLYTF